MAQTRASRDALTLSLCVSVSASALRFAWPQVHSKWEGWVESKVRHLVRALERLPLKDAKAALVIRPIPQLFKLHVRHKHKHHQRRRRTVAALCPERRVASLVVSQDEEWKVASSLLVALTLPAQNAGQAVCDLRPAISVRI